MKSFQHYVADVCKHVNEIDIRLLDQKLESPCLLLDIREPQEWCDGIIANAKCCPRGILESRIENLLSGVVGCPKHISGLPVYLYCHSGARSILAARSLQKMGLIHCYSVSGGIKAWCKAGYELVALSDEVIC